MFGHQRPASETPFKWRFAAGPMMARLYWYLNHLSHHQQKKYVVKVGPPSEKNFLDPRMGNDVQASIEASILISGILKYALNIKYYLF